MKRARRNRRIRRGAVVRLANGKRGIVVTTGSARLRLASNRAAVVCTHRGDYVNVFVAPLSSLTPVGDVQRMPKSCDAEFKHSSIWPDRSLKGSKRKRRR